jgi:hypothetical protein
MKQENEIFDAINKIYSDKDSKDRYGQTPIFEYREARLRKMLPQDSFDYLKSGKSVYGTFSTYGGSFGTYSALTITKEFYNRKRTLQTTQTL